MLTESGKFASGKARMLESTRKLLEAGKLPDRIQDMNLVPSTYYDYKETANRVLGILSKELRRELRMADFFAFGKVELVEPQTKMATWICANVSQPTIR